MSAEPEYMGKRWRVFVENFRNDPDDVARMRESLAEQGIDLPIPLSLPCCRLITEDGGSLTPDMSPGFAQVLGHAADLHNTWLGRGGQ